METNAKLKPEPVLLDETASHAPTAGPDPPLASGDSPPAMLGRYRILAQLGAGGMGVVYLAEDTLLRRQVALKALHARRAADPQARARFLREARAQAHVEHDNIIPIYDVVEEGTAAYLAMPLLKGTTLAAALKANPRLPIGVVVRIAREIAEGLAAAHAKGLVHRDIKPSNVWLEESRGGGFGRVRILDFGLARTEELNEEPLTAEGAFVGTPQYMSPEQANGSAVDTRTDLFSLGVVLYQMTTGKLPFAGNTIPALLLAVTSVTPPAASTVSMGIPPALDALIGKLLEKDPAKRVAAAETVANELRSIEHALNTVADEPTRSEPQTRRFRPPTAPWSFAIVMGAGILFLGPILVPLALKQYLGDRKVEAEPEPASIPQNVEPKTQPPPGDEAEFEYFVNGEKKTGRVKVHKLDLGGGLSMSFVPIASGSFQMGSPVSEPDAQGVEQPQHPVRISKLFYMGRYEVTQEEYAAVMKAKPGSPDEPKYPVNNVSWEQAAEFCKLVSKRTGKNVNLPTEAEWEYACRAGTTTRFHFGDNADKSLLNFDNNHGRPKNVGMYPANPWGLFDMHGNIYEWVRDYHVEKYRDSELTDPDYSLPEFKNENRRRRGGSFYEDSMRCRSAWRTYFQETNFREGQNGFRVAWYPE